jgi:peptidoglycan-associated lipoprotein
MNKAFRLSISMVVVFSFLFFMTSCAKKQVKSQEAAPSGMAPAPKAGAAPSESARPGAAASTADEKLRGEMKAFESESIYFDFDKADLKTEAQAILKKKAAWLSANPSFSLRIEGNCDERGTNEYNLALGERRASSAKKFLVTSGIAESRISTISYGEERPACAEKKEACFSKNRRDEFKLMSK